MKLTFRPHWQYESKWRLGNLAGAQYLQCCYEKNLLASRETPRTGGPQHLSSFLRYLFNTHSPILSLYGRIKYCLWILKYPILLIVNTACSTAETLLCEFYSVCVFWHVYIIAILRLTLYWLLRNPLAPYKVRSCRRSRCFRCDPRDSFRTHFNLLRLRVHQRFPWLIALMAKPTSRTMQF